jgi:uncharacterized membrane protein
MTTRDLSFSSPTITLVATVATGLAGGVFFAFSTFVMDGLGRLPDREGLAAMQQINKAAPTPAFMTLWLGTAILCVVIGVSAIRRWGEAPAGWLLLGAAMYLAMMVLTFAYHIPHNDALALLDPSAAGSGEKWRSYHTWWTVTNHLRTLACAASSVAFAVAYRLG